MGKLIIFSAGLLLAFTPPAMLPVTAGQGLGFSSGASNEFTFDTGVLRGKVRAGGKSMGLSSVVHVPTGIRLDRSMGLFSHYRVFSTNKRYGTAAWDWPSTARLRPDDSLEVWWPSAPDRPFELRAIYRWAAPNTLDLETSVQAQTNLLKFESFLASYWAEAFTNACVYARPGEQDPGPARFVPAEQSAGVWQVFPRDASVLPIIKDGRWKIEPNPVDWMVRPPLARPLGFRRSPASGLVAVLMAQPLDCFAIYTPHQTEPHYSMYLSLFGKDLKAGEIARARSRLVIGSGLSDPDIVRLYHSYVKP